MIDPRFTSYQASFLDHFVSEAKAGSVHILIAPAGTGKSLVVAAGVSELIRLDRSRRVLILTYFKTLVEQWSYILQDFGQSSLKLDGRELRLLREKIGGKTKEWPPGVYAASINFAARPDVRDLIADVQWDVIVMDDSRDMDESQLQYIRKLLDREKAPAMLFTTTVNDMNFAADAKVYNWNKEVNDFLSTKSVGSKQRIITTEICSYRRSEEEVAIMQEVMNFVTSLDQDTGLHLLEKASSSIVSLEDILVKLVDSSEATLEQVEKVENILSLVESLQVDSRLEKFRGLLDDLVKQGFRHIVVFCEYRETLAYLAGAIELLDVPKFQLQIDIPDSHRNTILKSFRSDGGVLIMTPVPEGVSLKFVDAVVHYDISISSFDMANRQGYYHRFSREDPCAVNFFNDESNALPLEGLLLKMHGKTERIIDVAELDTSEIWRKTVLAT